MADLAAAGRELVARHGLASVAGGRHPGWGTANRIVPLGDAYVELVAVVDESEAVQSAFGSWVAQGARAHAGPLGWAVRTNKLDEVARRLGLAVSGDRLDAWLGAHRLPVTVRPGPPALTSIVLTEAAGEIVLSQSSV